MVENLDELIMKSTSDIDFRRLDDLFESIGWNRRGEEKWRKVLEKSSYVCCIWDNDQVVGFGRILEDSVMCMFYDIGVNPKYQGRKVGTQIMNTLIDHVKGEGYASIGLFAWEENPQNIPFYEYLGFEKTYGMELIKYMIPE